jgi:hypothetical protein
LSNLSKSCQNLENWAKNTKILKRVGGGGEEEEEDL